MRVIRVRRRVDSETLQLPELRELIGKDVEILVLEEPATPGGIRRRAGLFGPCADCGPRPDRP